MQLAPVGDRPSAAEFTSCRIFSAVSRHGNVTGRTISEQAVLDIVRRYLEQIGVENICLHNLRPTCVKLCRSGGGELEQIQLLLGPSSIQINERYPSPKQHLQNAPNDRVALRWQKAS